MRRLIRVLLIVAAVLVVIVLALPFLVNANRFRPAIESKLSKSLNREVKIGDLKLGILSGTVTASDLSVADDPAFSHEPFLRAKMLAFSIDLWPALSSHKLNVKGIDIDKPEIVLIQAPSGQWNFSSLGTKSAPRQAEESPDEKLALSIKSLKIDDARVSLTQSPGKPATIDQVNVELSDFAPGAVFPFSLTAKIAGGGDVALAGKAGPIDPADAANTPLTTSLKLTNLNLAASGAVPASSGIDGIVSLDGSANSNGRVFDMAGKVKAEKLKLAPGATAARNPLLFDVALTQNLKQHSGRMSRGDVAIGGVKASLTGTWTQADQAPVLQMLFSAPGVPVSSLVDLLPALGIQLPAGSTLEGGTATTTLTISGPASATVIGGPARIQNTRLKGFDLGAKMAPIENLAGIQSGPNTEIQLLSANVRIAPEGTTLRNIHIVLPSLGELTGDGTIGRNQALNFAMKATVRSGTLLAAGPSSIPFFITGTTSNPQFRPDVGALAAEEIKRRLQGTQVGGTDAGKAAESILQGVFGGRKKK